jgi:hypothetical protein
MRFSRYSYYLLLFICLFNTKGYCQTDKSSLLLIQQKIEDFNKTQFRIPLFLHIDKTVYTENEPIWFSAYLLNNGAVDISKHKILHLFLFRYDDRTVALSGKFKIEKGISAGDLVLPDSIPAGKYELVAYTNVLDKHNKPITTFSTPITVKSTSVPGFKSSIELLDSTAKKESIRARLTVSVDRKDKTYPTAYFTIGKDTLQVVKIKENETIVDIPTTYLNADKSVLHTSVKYNNQVQHLNTLLPSPVKRNLQVNFLPESGDLVAGLPSLVAVETKDSEGNPVSVTGLLYKGDAIVDTIETNSNGTGKFSIVPEGKYVYSVKIKSSEHLVKDTIYKLPKLSSNRLTFHLPEAVTDDTLQLHLFSKRNDAALLQILIRNHNGAYILFKTKTTVKDTLKIPLDKLPKGIATLTVLDELNRPLGERLFFAHYSKGIETDINLNKSVYGVRSEVEAHITVKDSSQKPLKGLFSVAVVQSNRMESTFKFIDDYLYLEKGFEMPANTTHSGWSNYNNRDLLEDVLLVKGWRRYTWTDIMQADARDSVQTSDIPSVIGRVTKFKKTLKEPVELALLGGDHLNLIKTGKDGSFKLDREHLFVSGSNNRLTLMVSNGKNNGFSIELDDPSSGINRKLAQDMKVDDGTLGTSGLSKSQDGALGGMENVFQLEEVTVNGNKGNTSLYAYKGKPGPNACGDYVDDAGFLNYEYSTNRYQPVVGKLYEKRVDLSDDRVRFRVEPVVYYGCQTEEYTGALEVAGIYSEREFYGVDILQSEPQYLSTLCWKSHILTDDEGKAEIKFNAGDIKDEFSVIVQGVTNDEVFSKRKTFIVK